MPTIDILTPLKGLKETADALSKSAFNEGYRFALDHAIQLAKVLQIRINLRLAETGIENFESDELRREDEAARELDPYNAQTQDIKRNR